MLFKDFPADVAWHRATPTVSELGATKYLAREATWHGFAGGTRLVADGASNVGLLAGPTAVILGIVTGLEQGRSFPELILAGLVQRDPAKGSRYATSSAPTSRSFGHGPKARRGSLDSPTGRSLRP